MNNITHIIILISMPLLLIYWLFFKYNTVFNDLFFYTINCGVIILLSLQLSSKEFFKIRKKIYFCNGMLWGCILLLLYTILIVKGSENYILFTSKWHIGGLIMSLFLIIIVFYLKTSENDR